MRFKTLTHIVKVFGLTSGHKDTRSRPLVPLTSGESLSFFFSGESLSSFAHALGS